MVSVVLKTLLVNPSSLRFLRVLLMMLGLCCLVLDRLVMMDSLMNRRLSGGLHFVVMVAVVDRRMVFPVVRVLSVLDFVNY